MRCSPLLGSVGSWPVCCHRDIIVAHSPFLWWSSERLMKADVTAGSGWIQPENCGKQEERWERKVDLSEGFLSAGLPRQQVYVWQKESLGPKTCWLAKFQPAPAQESGHISGGSRRLKTSGVPPVAASHSCLNVNGRLTTLAVPVPPPRLLLPSYCSDFTSNTGFINGDVSRLASLACKCAGTTAIKLFYIECEHM